ncbi:MAG: prephenate dehydrogenase/arogenate dehydrogenase family protein, partial [SAR324 cluster bacterium]|nr:prephenate dehydrogenase/arogenate dehydrogenase family protein [SAR324 cluster bacterium]
MHPIKTAKNILIIGGKGKMGLLLEKLLSERGHNIASLDKEDVLDKDAIASADIVIIAVPMSIASSITKTVAPLSRKDGLLLDINSLKSEVCAIMKEHCQSECMGTHPLFGPSVKTIEGQNIIVCPIRGGELSEYFLCE